VNTLVKSVTSVYSVYREKNNMLSKFKPICWHLPRPSSDYPGCYPKFFEKRFLKFSGVDRKRVLHLFSGKSRMGLRVDIKLENRPDIVADCHHLPLRDNLDFDAVLADPPYDDEYAQRLYSTPHLKPRKYVQEMVRVARRGGLVVLYHVHQVKHPVGCKYLGVLAIVPRLNQTARVITFYKKDGHVPMGEYF
jgi:hypothetical protein